MNILAQAAGAACILACGCEPSQKASRNVASSPAPSQELPPMPLELSSPAFKNNEPIAERYTGDGEDVSPELTWSGVPAATRELALICDDPDAPSADPWVHWVIYKIPAAATGLSEHVATVETPPDPKGALQGKNSWGRIGYRGPAPPPGMVHHYHFKLYALDTALSVKAGLTKSQLLVAMEGHILATGELIGTYRR